MNYIPEDCVDEFTKLVLSSTIAHRLEWISMATKARAAKQKRSDLMTHRNTEAAKAAHADTDAAILQVAGATPLDEHGAATVIQKRIATAVRRGELSSTLGGTGEVSIKQLRHRMACIQMDSPVLAEHPAKFTSTYSSC